MFDQPFGGSGFAGPLVNILIYNNYYIAALASKGGYDGLGTASATTRCCNRMPPGSAMLSESKEALSTLSSVVSLLSELFLRRHRPLWCCCHLWHHHHLRRCCCLRRLCCSLAGAEVADHSVKSSLFNTLRTLSMWWPLWMLGPLPPIVTSESQNFPCVYFRSHITTDYIMYDADYVQDSFYSFYVFQYAQ